MKPATLLDELRARGAMVEARGARLHIEAPDELLTPQVLEAARRLKPSLLELLALEAQAASVAPVEVESLQVLAGSSTCGTPEPSEEHATRLRLARELGGILEALPGAKRLRSGAWRFEAQVWEHNQIVLLAAQRRGTTTNGYPLEWDAGAAFRAPTKNAINDTSDPQVLEAEE